MGPKRSTILFVLLAASILSTSFAGGERRFLEKYAVKVETKEITEMSSYGDEVVVRARILKVQTNDYGSFDPSPSLAKPKFKLIPN